MKRGSPMRRTELRRGTSSLRRSPLTRSSSLSPESPRRRAENGQRRVVVSVMRRICEGRCARCGRGDMPVRGHERIARAHGGDILHPDCLLCDLCNGAIEDSPRVSCWLGWKISPKHPHDPVLQPWEARDLDGNIVDFRVLTEDVA